MSAPRWYRLGEGTLGITSDDPALAERFEDIYGDCAVDVPEDGPRVVCRATVAGGVIDVEFTDPEPLDVARFLGSVFPERGYTPVISPDGAVTIPLPGSAGDLVIRGDRLTAPADAPWQPLVANLAVSRLMRLQRSVMFFHAASLAVRGRGVMACGPKRSGKTTLALSLAARGHTFLGDEVAALRTGDRSLMPFRRSLAIRTGPASTATARLLDRSPEVVERFPDGELRRRLPVEQLGVAPATGPVVLTSVFILRHFKDRTEIGPLRLEPRLIGSLTPMSASLWNRPAGATALRLIAALSGAKIYEVYAGPPDETADAIEQVLEG